VPYIDLGVTTDAVRLQQDGLDYIVDQSPGWEPDPLTEWILAAVARMAVEVAILSGQIDPWIFTYFGEKVLRIPAIAAAAATATVTFTLTDTLGHTITAGAQVDIDGFGFTTTEDLVIAPGASTGVVPVVAAQAGADASGLAGSSVDLRSPTLIWVDSVALVGTTTGGVDAETGTDYVDRLADELPTLSPKAILIDDFEVLPTTIAGVDLAVAIDNYIPAGPGGTPPAVIGAENAVTIALRDESGGPVASGVKTLVNTLLTGDGERITGTLISLIDADYQPVAAAFAVQVAAGWDVATVNAQVVAALAGFLDPAIYGIDQTSGRGRRWRNEPTVRRNDLIAVAYGVEGVRHVSEMWLGGPRAVTATASTDVINDAAHPFADDDPVILTALTGGAGLSTGVVLYVRNSAAGTYKLATSPGGTPINITTDASAASLIAASTTDVALPTPVGLPLASDIAGTATL
jgi:hypothetical protein